MVRVAGSSPLDTRKFDCGCVWRWWVGKPDPRNCKWERRCNSHRNQQVDDCNCLNKGQDDGAQTCWEHHDCSDGSCTHYE